MEKIYLGMNLGFNTSACVMSTKRGLLAACSQERLTNKKNTKIIPFEAISKVIEVAKVKKIDEVVIGHYQDIREAEFKNSKYRNPSVELTGVFWKDYILNYVKSLGIKLNTADVWRCDHQTAHRNSGLAFYGIPDNPYITISSDGFGDCLSGTIALNTGNAERMLSTVRTENSIALVYQFVTGSLGFKEHEHEGKVTGLAAWGQPKYLEDFESLFKKVDFGNGLQFIHDNKYFEGFDEKDRELIENNPIYDFEDFLRLKKTIYSLCGKLIESGATREDLAATVQIFAEKWTVSWIEKTMAKHSDIKYDAYIAGGLFANVKINQRINESKVFCNVNVTPPMGDEGTSAGACVTRMKQLNELNFKHSIDNFCTCSGPTIDNYGNTEGIVSEVTSILEKKGLLDSVNISVFNKESSLIDYVTDALKNNQIVSMVRGKMEFGPRALCHRTIFYNADAYETNGWLNKKLNRSEFMPFAPVTIDKFAPTLFKNLEGGERSAQFMTMTFDAKEEFVNNCKAACHVDNTARPQIVTPESDAFTYKLITSYFLKTMKKCLINTSFNTHSFPIVWNEKIAVETWLNSGTEMLVIENVVLELKNPEPHETCGDGKWDPLAQK